MLIPLLIIGVQCLVTCGLYASYRFWKGHAQGLESNRDKYRELWFKRATEVRQLKKELEQYKFNK
jgi:predicted secreted protein